MEQYGVTDKGFVMKRLDTIIQEVQTDLSAALGFDVSQNPQSLLNSALIIPFCDKIAEMWEVAQESYYAKYPTTAEGINLDNACQYGNVFRRGNKRTEYIIHCTAKDGTKIPSGSLIASTTNPVVQLQCINDAVVERSACNSIAIKPVVNLAGTYVIELNGIFYSYEAKAGNTTEDILDGLAKAFNVDGYIVSKVLDNGSAFILIEDSIISRSNNFALSSNLTTEYVTSCVHFYTVDYGNIECPKGSITVLISNVTGLISVTNRIDPTPGRIQQDDISLRQEYIRKSYGTSSTQTNSVEAYILETVAGVKDVRCYENQYNVEDDLGRPPHCIEVIVDGGEPEKIAAAILAKKAGGITSYGDITINVLGEYGDSIPISFRRPEQLYLWIKVEITTDGSTITPDYVNVVKDAICTKAEELSIGDSFLTQTYISGIYEALTGISYCKIMVASTMSISVVPEKYMDSNIYATERQAISVDGTRIEVSLTT